MAGILTYLENIKDPRLMRTKRHLLKDILVITICSVLSGCDDWEDIAMYGESNILWFKTFLELPNGIPSHDTINRVFSIIDPKEFQDNFLKWVENVSSFTKGRVIAIDGKRLCNSGTDGKKSLVHMVSAWSSENNMILGQLKTEEKSNEIKAIPNLLDVLMVEGAIITIDAMGCQKAIASKIIKQKADYVLAVKENQPSLYNAIKLAFSNCKELDQESKLFESTDWGLGHGRIERRKCTSISNVSSIIKTNEWEGLQSIVQIESERTDKKTGKKQSELRYYISSLTSDSSQFNSIAR